ncbi:MAG TPA: hypothetical protein VGQ93_00655 [Lysobacter sp.]|jgi:hypothetical protein|nr:hypothetical protein [Lysobacter sp.]
MQEWVLIAGVVIVGLGVWLAMRNTRRTGPSQDSDAGTTFFAADGDGHASSTAYDCADTSNDSNGCDSDGGGDGGGGTD